MHRFSLLPLTALCAALWALSGCYTYANVPPSGARLGERVRVRVSGAEAERLEPVIVLTDRSVEGDLLEQTENSIALGVTIPWTAGGPAGAQPQQRIVIPRAEMQEMELRRLDKFRTSLLVGAAVAVAVGIAISEGSSVLGGSGASGSPNERRVPKGLPVLWRWAVP